MTLPARNRFLWKSRARKALFLCVVLLGFSVFLEGSFRLLALLGGHRPSSPIMFQQIPKDLFLPDSDGKVVRAAIGGDRRKGFSTRKDEKTFRIFCLGGSATKGLGFPRNGAFSFWLERMMKLSYPDWKIEVVNMGEIGYASEQVKHVAKEILRNAEPDLIVVYSGNNEFLDYKAKRAVRAEFEKKTSRRSHLFGARFALFRFIETRRPEWRRIVEQTPDIFKDYHNVWLLPDEEEMVYARYERNLREIADLAAEKKTRLVLSTLIADPFPNAAFELVGAFEIKDDEERIALKHAVGWARLGRWDKARSTLGGIASFKEIGPRVRARLLRVWEAGGIRGLNKLSPEARADVEDAARTLLPELEAADASEPYALYARAVCYRILGREQALGEFLGTLDRRPEYRNRGTEDQQNVLFSQFLDKETYAGAFRDGWRRSPGNVTATPRTNEIVRRVAKEKGVVLADIEGGLPEFYEPTARRYLIDYCHFNIEGAFEAARIIFESALHAGALPGPQEPEPHVFRKELLNPDLEWLRVKGYDFLDRDRWMGMFFRVCCCYCEAEPALNTYKKWFKEDAGAFEDKSVVEAFRRLEMDSQEN